MKKINNNYRNSVYHIRGSYARFIINLCTVFENFCNFNHYSSEAVSSYAFYNNSRCLQLFQTFLCGWSFLIAVQFVILYLLQKSDSQVLNKFNYYALMFS